MAARRGRRERRLRPALGAAVVLAALGACGGGGLPAVEGPTRDVLELDASEFRYDPENIAVEAGRVPVVLRNVGLVIHDLRIEGKPTFLVEAKAGETATATWDLPEGRFEIYCSIEGHRAAGMEGILEVRPAA